jgi:hypothetical protein
VLRRFLYGVAAVLAIAPLVAVAVSAAAPSASAGTVCDGNYEIYMQNTVTDGVKSQWYSPSGTVNDSHANTTYFCQIAVTGGVELRQQGTSGCATFDATDNTVQIENCDPSSITSQVWDWNSGHYWFTQYQVDHSEDNSFLEGDGGDTPVYFAPEANEGQQHWENWCVANCTV